MSAEYDVVVVGAGLAGLRAAQLLQSAGKRVLVLEAQDRVGGRTFATQFAGRTIDLGGQWIGPGQHRALALARALELRTTPQHTAGAARWILGSHHGTMRGLVPQLPLVQLARMLLTISRLELRALRVPRAAPWSAAHATTWDQQSLADFLRKHAGGGLAHAMLTAAMRVAFAAEPSDVSLLHALCYIHAGHGLRQILSTTRGAQQQWLPEGAGTMALALARDLEVKLAEPVQAVDASASQIQLTTAHGRYLGRRAVIAIAPVLTQSIAWNPALPAARVGLARGTPMGAVIKCFVQYERAFWRDAGLSGEAFSDGPAGLIMDVTLPGVGEGTLAVFLVGDHARQYAGKPDDRRRAVLSALSEQFGAEAANPIAYRDHDWGSEAYARGCYSGLFDLGTLSAYGGALREQVGRIHWAGTETATEYEGYMEGALASAERVAQEVLRAD